MAASGLGPHGGPSTPVITVKVVDTFPLASVLTSFMSEGGLQLTGTSEFTTPPRWTMGWLASLLHSRTLPIEDLA